MLGHLVGFAMSLRASKEVFNVKKRLRKFSVDGFLVPMAHVYFGPFGGYVWHC